MDARAQLDARPPSTDTDASPSDAGADVVVDAAIDAAIDAGPACFAAGSALISYFPLDGSPEDELEPGASVIALGEEFGPGQVGSALHAGELEITQSRLDAPSALTIAAWLRLDNAPDGLNAAWLWKGDESASDFTTGYWLVIAGPQFYSQNAKYLAGTPAQGHLGFALTDGTDEQFLLTDEPFPLLQYAHVVATFDGSRARLYLDGELVRDEAQLVQPRATINPLRLASPLGGAVGPLPGELDEVALFDRALTPSEVGQLYQRNGVVCTQ
jgi:hypothetical protein